MISRHRRNNFIVGCSYRYTPEEGRRAQRSKRCVTSQNINSVNNKFPLQKFREIILVLNRIFRPSYSPLYFYIFCICFTLTSPLSSSHLHLSLLLTILHSVFLQLRVITFRFTLLPYLRILSI